MHGPALSNRTSAHHASSAPTTYVWFIASVAALGGLLFGYDWVVIGGARQFYEEYFHISSAALVGWANSCALLGCLAGSLLSGNTADRYGRRRLLMLSAVMFTVSSIATGWAFSFPAFIAWRITGGVAIGIASNISPIYIAEISPAPSRGRLVSLNQFAIVVGILMAQIANAWIAHSERGAGFATAHVWNVTYGWRWMFSAVAVPSVLFFIGAFFLPESPRWLAAKGEEAAAANVLRKIAGAAEAAIEMDAIRASLRGTTKTSGGWSMLLHRPYARLLLLGVALAVLQQWTGINILFNYASEIYSKAGYGSSDILLNIVITGSINLLSTVLAMLLVDTVGRRKLMLAGCAGIAVSHLLCASAYSHHLMGTPVLLLTLLAIAFYACTLAPVTWVLISELFPNSIRSQGVSASVSALWVASFLLTYTFPLLQGALGTAGTFRIYGGVCIAGFFLVWIAYRETSGISLEDINEIS